MKQIFIVASLVATMIISSCSNNTQQSNAPVANIVSTSATLAYVEVERVLSESDIFSKEGSPLQKRTEAAQRDWQQKDQKLQSEAAQLQQKYQGGLITSANAQKEQASIESRVRAFQEATQKQAQELDEESAVFTNRMQVLLLAAIKNVNKDNRYSMIVNSTSLIDADTTLNISTLVLDEFNRLYKEEK